MVRLRRELEGIHRDRAVPTPGYAADPTASALILPGLDRRARALVGDRVLVAGEPRVDLALELAETGHWVTVTDLDAERLADVHAQASPQAAGRLTLVDKAYGDAAFGPSSFDTVLLYDAIHAYDRPAWLVRKVERELKFDGYLIARLLVKGPIDAERSGEQANTSSPNRALQRVARRCIERVEAGCASPLAPILLDGRGRDAVDRGAHLQRGRFSGSMDSLAEILDRQLVAEQWWIGHTLRLRACDLLFGARLALRQTLLRALPVLPECADTADIALSDSRVVGLVARKALGGKGAPAWGR